MSCNYHQEQERIRQKYLPILTNQNKKALIHLKFDENMSVMAPKIRIEPLQQNVVQKRLNLNRSGTSVEMR